MKNTSNVAAQLPDSISFSILEIMFFYIPDSQNEIILYQQLWRGTFMKNTSNVAGDSADAIAFSDLSILVLYIPDSQNEIIGS